MTGNPEDPPFDVEETPIDQSEVTHARTDSHVRFEGIVDSLYEESPASPPRTDPEMNTEALPPHPHTDTTEKPYDWRIYRPRGSSMVRGVLEIFAMLLVLCVSVLPFDLSHTPVIWFFFLLLH